MCECLSKHTISDFTIAVNLNLHPGFLNSSRLILKQKAQQISKMSSIRAPPLRSGKLEDVPRNFGLLAKLNSLKTFCNVVRHFKLAAE